MPSREENLHPDAGQISTKTMSMTRDEISGSAKGNADAFLDPLKEKSLFLKHDMAIFPVIMAIYLLWFLGRTNIGNVKVAGMTDDIGASTQQFIATVSIFYVPHIFSEIPLAVLLWWLNSHCSLLGLCALWSSVMILSRFIANISQLYISRFLLGTCEAGLFPGLHLYLTTIYTREEQATRISYLLMCTKFSGAMGGLLAFATLKMDGTAGYAGWRWVYIIEGTSRTLNGIEFGTSNTLKS